MTKANLSKISDKQARFIAEKMLAILQEIQRTRGSAPPLPHGFESTGIVVDPKYARFVYERDAR